MKDSKVWERSITTAPGARTQSAARTPGSGQWRVPWEIIPGIPLRIGIFLLEYFFWNIFPCRYAIPHRGACRGIIV